MSRVESWRQGTPTHQRKIKNMLHMIEGMESVSYYMSCSQLALLDLEFSYEFNFIFDRPYNIINKCVELLYFHH